MYKINGYDLWTAFGIMADGDRSTADSFERLPEPIEPYSHTWPDGVVEYDLLAPVKVKPREFTIKGYMLAETIEGYTTQRANLNATIRQAYVTLEHVKLGIKVNAKLKSVGNWHRLTHFNSDKIAVQFTLTFAEVLQTATYIDDSAIAFNVDANRDLLYTSINNTIFRFSIVDGNLILTT